MARALILLLVALTGCQSYYDCRQHNGRDVCVRDGG